MSDKLIPTEGDSLAAGLSPDESAGIPGLAGFGPAPTPPPMGTGSDSKISGQVVIAGVVLVLAAGAIYGMRFVGLNATTGGKDVKIDYTAQTSTPEMNRRFGRVMTELDDSMSAVQFASGTDLPPAPFTRPNTEEPTLDTIIEQPNSMDDLERLARLAAEQRRLEQEQRSAMLEGEVARLIVQSIIGGRVPVARVNGQPVTVGRMLGSFEVIEISGQSVYIRNGDLTYELPMGMPARLLD